MGENTHEWIYILQKHMNNIFRVQLAILDIYIWSKLIFEQLHNTIYSYLHIMLNL